MHEDGGCGGFASHRGGGQFGGMKRVAHAGEANREAVARAIADDDVDALRPRPRDPRERRGQQSPGETRDRETVGERGDLRAGANAIGSGERQAACQCVETCEDRRAQHGAAAVVRSPMAAEYGSAQPFPERPLGEVGQRP